MNILEMSVLVVEFFDGTFRHDVGLDFVILGRHTGGCEDVIDGGGVVSVAERSGVGAAEFLPCEFACTHAVGDFGREVD